MDYKYVEKRVAEFIRRSLEHVPIRSLEHTRQAIKDFCGQDCTVEADPDDPTKVWITYPMPLNFIDFILTAEPENDTIYADIEDANSASC